MSESSGSTPPLNPVLEPLAWLLGKWRSEEGNAFYPTMKDFAYGEEIEFFHVGQPNIQFSSNSWPAGTKKPLHRECGYIRIQPGTNHVALIAAQNIGLSEIEEGEVNGQELKLETRHIGRMSFGKEPAVTKVARNFKRDGDKLEAVLSMETTKTKLQEHLKVTYTKVN